MAINKSAKRLNFHKGSLSHSPSQTNGKAKVQINSEIAIPKLQKLAETYLGVSDPHRFLTDLRVFPSAGICNPCVTLLWICNPLKQLHIVFLE